MHCFSVYDLQYPFMGNAHVVYNGSFYYQAKNSNDIVRYNLKSKNSTKMSVPFHFNSSTPKLYSGQYNYMDFNVDDNGMWVVFPVPDSENTAIMKVGMEDRLVISERGLYLRLQ